MGRAPCCAKVGLHKGPWTPKEDALLTKYVQAHGEGQWKSLPKKAGLLRCGKSCRLRWMNYLRPDIKRGNITPEEDDLIIRMHSLLGNRWSLIAGRIPGRTDNEIKNYWNTHLSKKLMRNQETSCDDDVTTNKVVADQKEGGSKKKKNNKRKRKDDKMKGSNNEEEEKTQIYLPKPIRIKALNLPRTTTTTDSGNSLTFDSNSGSASASASFASQEETNEQVAINNNNNNNNNYNYNNVVEVGENDGFGFSNEEHELVKDGFECESYFATDHEHGTLERVYEEYLQLLNMDDLDSFVESAFLV